jgi:hypothetical protein
MEKMAVFAYQIWIIHFHVSCIYFDSLYQDKFKIVNWNVEKKNENNLDCHPFYSNFSYLENFIHFNFFVTLD